VSQEPEGSQPPVNLRTLTPICGLLDSPHNLNAMLFDNASHLGSFSQVSSIDENPVYEQTSQVVQLWQVSHPQGSGKIQLVGYGDGVGVGVGVGKITSPQM
jgi:hypothetical protein